MHKHHLLSKVAQVATLSTIATWSVSVFAESPPLPQGTCPSGTETIAKFDNPDVGKNWGYRYYDDDGVLINIVNLDGATWTSEAPITHIVCAGAVTEVSGSKSGTLPEPCASAESYTKLQFCGNVATIPQCDSWKFRADSFEDGTTVRNLREKTDGSWLHDTVAGRNIRNPFNWIPAPKYQGDPVPFEDFNEAEIYGIAIRETMTVYKKEFDATPAKEGQIMVAFNTNVPLEGNDMSWLPEDITSDWTDPYSGLGDLIFNFNGVKYAVHFTNNDAGVTEFGVYKDITLKDVTKKNFGWPSLKDYMAAVEKVTGEAASCGDVPCTDFPGYGTNRYGQMVIKTGTKIADVTLLKEHELPDFAAGLGVDASQLGKYTYGFKFSKEASGLGKAEVGDVTAYIFLECFNDGVAINTALGCECVAEENDGSRKSSRGCELLGNGVTNLVATVVDSGVKLSWAVEGENGILNVLRAEKDADGKYINLVKIAGGLAGDTTTYTDASAATGKTYYYAVEQIGLDGKSIYSEVVSATK